MSEYKHIVHGFEPVFDENSRILILGSLPSVKSREQNFYYGHPRNRFWQVTASVFGCVTPETTEQKKEFLLSNNTALWDVIAECDIIGSSDASIKNVVPTDLRVILDNADIRAIFANGAAAGRIFNKFQRQFINRDIIVLPSTSPANAAYSLPKLTENWKIINDNARR